MKQHNNRVSNVFRTSMLCSATALSLVAVPILAQTTAQPVVEDEHSGLEEIIVTAQKRAENLQVVPIAVSALTGETIERLQAVSLQGLQGTVPSIQIGSFANTPNTAVFSIRGIGVIDPDPYAGNTVSIVVDGIPQYFSYGALLDLFDVDRVEVLRGPQGTLFGANTTGGVVNVVTRQPTGEFGGRAEVTYGNWNRLDIKAAVDVPLVTDVLAAKVAVMHHGRDGWVTNIADGSDMGSQDVTALRGYLKYTPDSNFKATLIGEYSRSRNGSPVVVNGAVPGEALYVPPITLPGAVLPMYASPCLPVGQPCHAPDKYYSGSSGEPNQSNMDNYRMTLAMDLSDTAIGDISSITGYRRFVLHEATDQDGTSVLFHANRRRTRGWQFSQELRTSVDVTDTINLLVGGSYMKTHYDHFQNYLLQFAAPGFRQYSTQDQDNWSGSLFAHTYIDLTDKLRLQGGLRFTHEKTVMVDGVSNFINFDGPSIYSGDTPLGGFDVKGSKAWNKLGWKVGLDYKATEDLMLYGYYARGFKSGGFVGRITRAPDIGPYNPETVDTFEAGFKADWFDHHLRTNLSAFYTVYKDMQLAQIYFAPNEAGVLVNGNTILNAAKAHIKGIEFEVELAPVEGLKLNSAVTYLDATYKEFDYTDIDTSGNKVVRNLSGYTLQNAPKWAGTAGATYTFALGSGKTTASLIYTYTGKKFNYSLLDTARSTVQATNYFNGNLDWSPDSDRWTIGLWGRNIFDKRYIASVYDAPGVFGLVSYASPREVGATFKYHW